MNIIRAILRLFCREKPEPDQWADLRTAAPDGVRELEIRPFENDANRPVVLFKPPKSDYPVAIPLPVATLSEEGWFAWWKNALAAIEDESDRAEATLNWLRTQPTYQDGRVAILLAAYEALKAVGVETYGLEITDAPDGHFLIGGEHLDGPKARGAMTRGKPGDTNKHPVNSKRYPAGDREFFEEWALSLKERHA